MRSDRCNSSSLKFRKMWKLFVIISICQADNVAFISHLSYQGNILLTASFTTTNYALSQGRLFADAFCLKLCASRANCQSAQTLIFATTPHLVTCRLYNDSICNYTVIQTKVDFTISEGKIWDKVPNLLREMRACIDYPYWASNRNCTAATGYVGFIGLKCDDAPRCCRDYFIRGVSQPGDTLRPLWPWGITGRQTKGFCDQDLTMIYCLYQNGGLYWIGSDSYQLASTVAAITSLINTNWDFPVISQMSKAGSGGCLFNTAFGRSNFTGCYFAPDGRLNISAFKEGPGGNGIGAPLVNAPFVNTSTAVATCGLFWYLTNNGSSPPATFNTCQQRARGFAGFTARHMWNNVSYDNYPFAIYLM